MIGMDGVHTSSIELPLLDDFAAEALWRGLLSQEAGAPPRPTAPATEDEKKFVHIDGQGRASLVAVDKHELVHQWKLRYRDIAGVDPTLPVPTPSVILVRPRAILVNLDVGGCLKMIIGLDQCLVLTVPKASDPSLTALPTLNHPLVRRLCRSLRHEPSRHELLGSTAPPGAFHFDQDMPCELRALEVCLTAAVGILAAEIDRFEEQAYPIVDAMAHSVDRAVLESVRGVKQGVDRLQLRVGRIHQELEELLGDDLDMRDLFLGRRATEQGLGPRAQPGEGSGSEGGSSSGQEPGANDSGDNEEGEVRGRAAAGPDNDGARHPEAGQHAGGLLVQRGGVHRGTEGAALGRRRRPGHAGHGRLRSGLDATSIGLVGVGMASHSGPPFGEHAGDEWGRSTSSLRPSPSLSWAGPLAVDPREIEDAEDLLDSFFVKTDLLLRRLAMLDERIDDTEDFVEIQLDQRRNEIVGLNLLVSSISMAFAWSAVLGGIFGMNLANTNLQQDTWVLIVVLVAMVVVSTALLAGVMIYAQRHKLMFIPQRL